MDYSSILVQVIQTATLIVAVFVAWFAMKKQRDATKKDKTISLLMKDIEDEFLAKGLKTLREVDEKFHIRGFFQRG